ncbi:HD domain-containing protein [Natranaerovirga pectinivora]|uniref:HD domain-containing protein n=1 Tax=Natranaerovirga pectinivora TaxID=682400 RepID=A0A4R3MEC9_9FIRM|nr:HD domain-containing phosphohydrolase [Natranaerovirga pectinivora]TCT12144.1 HD domain-containing protein [Natranaerovirga pectinivora]
MTLNYTKKLVKDIIPGEIVLHPIYRSDGLLLINKYKELTQEVISTIQTNLSSNSILIVTSNKGELNLFLNSSYSQDTFKKDLDILSKDFNLGSNVTFSTASSFDLTSTIDKGCFFIDLLSKIPLWHSIDHLFEATHLKNRAIQFKEKFITKLTTEKVFHSWLTTILNYDDNLMVHSINITSISLIIGLTLELQDDLLQDLCFAALFSNLGFTKIPKDKLAFELKNNQLYTYVIQKHLEVFSSITMESPNLRRKQIIYGILDSHEHYDGTGPHNKKGNEISLIGRILNLSHSYDALVNGYEYTTGMVPFQALKSICEGKNTRFDPYIINTFIHRTTFFNLGQTIHLTNTVKGIIVGFYDYLNYPYLPVLKLEDGRIIDLVKVYYNK